MRKTADGIETLGWYKPKADVAIFFFFWCHANSIVWFCLLLPLESLRVLFLTFRASATSCGSRIKVLIPYVFWILFQKAQNILAVHIYYPSSELLYLEFYCQIMLFKAVLLGPFHVCWFIYFDLLLVVKIWGRLNPEAYLQQSKNYPIKIISKEIVKLSKMGVRGCKECMW